MYRIRNNFSFNKIMELNMDMDMDVWKWKRRRRLRRVLRGEWWFARGLSLWIFKRCVYVYISLYFVIEYGVIVWVGWWIDIGAYLPQHICGRERNLLGISPVSHVARSGLLLHTRRDVREGEWKRKNKNKNKEKMDKEKEKEDCGRRFKMTRKTRWSCSLAAAR